MMVFKDILIISSFCVLINLQNAVCETTHEMRTFDLPDEIVQAMNSGDTKVISSWFNSSVELIFSDSRGIYGKAQAEQILKTFFSSNTSPDRRFSYKHLHSTGNKGNAQYIGELHTGKGSYRVHIFMKDQRIHQMRIDSND